MQICKNIFRYFTQQIHMYNDECHCGPLLVHDILQKAFSFVQNTFLSYSHLFVFTARERCYNTLVLAKQQKMSINTCSLHQ